MALRVDRLSNALGGEVAGIALGPDIAEQTIADIRAALWRHQVLVFRDQSLGPEQQVGFSRRFGELVVRVSGDFLHPEYPEVLVLSNRVVDGKAAGASVAYAGQFWHTDLTYAERPSMGSMLHALEVAEEGGDTAWANMYTAWDTLPEATRRRIEGLRAIHVRDRRRNPRTPLDDEFDRDVNAYYSIEVPDSLHPMVRTHPETGRKALYVNSAFTTHIQGMKQDESRATLDFLFRHVQGSGFQCRFRWQPDSIAFWDNRCVQHHAIWDYYPNVRHGYRVTIEGDRPC